MALKYQKIKNFAYESLMTNLVIWVCNIGFELGMKDCSKKNVECFS